jgi:endonuclease/exonuclease/phosphatase family metal-dependent hydrolase
MTFTCATYNILHGYHEDMILRNIGFLMGKSADIICLQEAEVTFEGSLRDFLKKETEGAWEFLSVHAGYGGNIAILWNTKRFTLRDSTVIALPKLRIHRSIPRLHKIAEKTNRVALVAEFDLDGQSVQITNTHLAWEGGSRHRMRQLRHLRDAVTKRPADFRVVTGDFNTVSTRPLRRMQERRVEKTLGSDFRNAFPRLRWTYDISFTDPKNGPQFVATLAKAGLKWRQRFDYMFAKDMTVITGEMHDLPGSDHRPLIATFGLLPKAKGLQLSN